MVLMLGLMLFGTVTIINLLVGLVISDVRKLQEDVLKRVCSLKFMLLFFKITLELD